MYMKVKQNFYHAGNTAVIFH